MHIHIRIYTYVCIYIGKVVTLKQIRILLYSNSSLDCFDTRVAKKFRWRTRTFS